MKSKNKQLAFILFTAFLLMAFALVGCSCDKQKNKASGEKANIKKTSDGVFVTDPFESLYAAMGPGSSGDARDKKNIWASYRGKSVIWTAKMGAMKLLADKSLAAELVHIRTKDGVEAVCNVNFPPEEVERTMKIPPGTEVRYQGKLVNYTSSENVTVFYLKNGKILRTDPN